MSDRCSCVDGPNYRCGIGRPCDVHGNVEALMAWGEYVDRRGGVWQHVQIMSEWVLPVMGWANGSRYLNPAQMRLRIVREQHSEVCPGLLHCRNHPVPTVTVPRRLGCYYIYVAGEQCGHEHDLEWAIDAAQRLAKETT